MHFGSQNVNRAQALEKAPLLAALGLDALSGMSAAERGLVVNFAAGTPEHSYTVRAAAGDSLVVATGTPGDGSGEPANGLDPALDLYDPAGALVATAAGGAADGRNAVLAYAVPAGAGGAYRLVVRGTGATGGDYTLRVTGATGPAAAPTATGASPADGALLAGFPVTYRVDFSEPILLSSVAPGDLRVNGVPASAVTAVDGDTLLFTIANANTGDGVYTVIIAPGVLTSLAGAAVAGYSATFDTDVTAPRVVSGSLAPGDVVPVGSLVYQVVFSEAVARSGLGAEDVTLVDTRTGAAFTPPGFIYDDATATLTVTYSNLPEGVYALTLLSSATAFRDRRGNLLDGSPGSPLPSGDGTPGGDYVVYFSVDTGTRPFPAPLEVRPPVGGLVVSDPTATGYISPATDTDTDTFTLDVEPGQLVTLVVTPADDLSPTVTLVSPAGDTLAVGTAAAAGQPAVVQVHPAAVGGTYRVVVGGAAGSGGYTLRVVLNAQAEAEGNGGPANDTLAAAEDLTPSLLVLPGGASRMAVTGESGGEPDFYRFTLAAGQFATLAAAPLAGALVELDLYTAAGTLVARSIRDDSGRGLQVANFVAAGGEYVARVRGAAGARYNLLVVRDAGLDLEPNDDPVRNGGTDPAVEGWQDGIYLSTDAVLDRDDRRLLVVPTTPTRGPLDAAGGAADRYTRTETVRLPLDLASAGGTYYLIVEADVNRRQPESGEANNAAASPALALTLPALPDLVVTDIRAPIEALSGQEVELTWTVRNQGGADFTGTHRDQVFLSADAAAGNDQFFNNFDFTGTIPAGGAITRVQRITLPINLEGGRYVVVRTDAADAAFEHAGESNNVTVDDAAVAVRLSPLPNLRVAAVTPPPTAFSGQQTVVEWVVTNVGTGPTSAPVWYDAVYLSTDDVLDAQDVYLGAAANASYLNPGESYAGSLAVALPRGISGPYRFLVQTDSTNYVYEHTAEDDNVRAGAATAVQLTPPPDLRVAAVNAPTQAFSGQPMSLTWTVANAGPGRTVESSWADAVYLSADAVLDAGDRLLGAFGRDGALTAGADYTPTRTVTLPTGVSGDFFVFVRADVYGQVFEHAFEGNNVGSDATPVRVNLTPPPDLEVTAAAAPATALANHPLSVTYTVANNGATETTAAAWTDRVYLSADATLDPAADLLLAARTHYGALEPGAEYRATVTGTLPQILAGGFHVFVVTDAADQVFELDNANNTRKTAGTVRVDFRPPDLVVTGFTAPAAGAAGSTVVVGWTVADQGIGDTVATAWADRVVLSTDAVFGNGDDLVLLDQAHAGALAAGAGYAVAGVAVPVPVTVAAGNYFLFLQPTPAGRCSRTPPRATTSPPPARSRSPGSRPTCG